MYVYHIIVYILCIYIYIIIYKYVYTCMTLVVAVSFLHKVPDNQSLLTILLDMAKTCENSTGRGWAVSGANSDHVELASIYAIRNGFHGRYHRTPSYTTKQIVCQLLIDHIHPKRKCAA